MAVPKRKKSRSRTRSRRAQWRADTPELVTVVVNGQTRRIPRRLVSAAKRGYL